MVLGGFWLIWYVGNIDGMYMEIGVLRGEFPIWWIGWLTMGGGK